MPHSFAMPLIRIILMKIHATRSFCLPAMLAVAFAVTTASCGKKSTPPEAPATLVDKDGKLHVPDASPLRKKLLVETVVSKNAPHALSVPAAVEADPARSIPVLAPTTGRIVDVKVALGDPVGKGQTLLTIASGDSAQAYSDVDKARDALDLARRQLDRARAVKDAGGEAARDVEAAQSAMNQAQAEYDRANSRLASLGSMGGKGGARTITVSAPIAANVTTLAVAPGQFVNDATMAMMTLSNIDRVYVTANVPENQAGLVAAGQSVDVALAAFPGDVLHGTVQSVDNVLAADTRRQKARIVFGNADGRLKPNMYATATFQLPQAPQVFVPQSALLMNNDSVTVFVETAPWTFERRKVVLGFDEGVDARIASGLTAGERVVVKGGVLIND